MNNPEGLGNSADGGAARWRWTRRRYWLLLGTFALLRLVQASLLPLSGDEAYYWDLSRRWAWSSFDQPLLVVWAMVPFRLLLGETALAVRMPAVLSGTLIGVFLLPLVRRLGGTDAHAARAFLLLQATPLVFLGSAYASTDVAMAAAVVAATVSAMAVADGDRRGWWWFALALGVGFQAKFPAVLALAAILAALAVSPSARRHLATPTPYLAALLTLGFTIPVWVWAVQHDFANFSFQLADRHQGGGFTLLHLAGLLAASAILTSPPLFAAAAGAWWRGWRHRGPAWTVLLVTAAAPFAFFAVVGLRTPVGGHWAAPGILLAFAVLALEKRPPRALIRTGVVVGIALTAVLVGVVLAAEPILRARSGPLAVVGDRLERAIAEVVGNREIAGEIELRLRPGELAAATSYSKGHLFDFLTGGRLDMHLALLSEGRHGLDALYRHRPQDLRGRDVLVVTERDGAEEGLRQVCTRVRREADYRVMRGNRVLRVVRFVRCENLHSPEGVFTRLPDWSEEAPAPPAEARAP